MTVFAPVLATFSVGAVEVLVWAGVKITVVPAVIELTVGVVLLTT